MNWAKTEKNEKGMRKIIQRTSAINKFNQYAAEPVIRNM